VAQLREVWLGLPNSLAFFGKLRRLKKWYKAFCRSKATERRAQESQLRQCLKQAHETLQVDPVNNQAQSDLALVADQLQELEEWNVADQRV
jgi:hypothetical protein